MRTRSRCLGLRGHSTYGSSSNPLASDDLSTAKVTGLGDVRVIGTYQGLLEAKNLGLQFGLKLSTGRYGGPNADAFEAEASRIDRPHLNL